MVSSSWSKFCHLPEKFRWNPWFSFLILYKQTRDKLKVKSFVEGGGRGAGRIRGGEGGGGRGVSSWTPLTRPPRIPSERCEKGEAPRLSERESSHMAYSMRREERRRREILEGREGEGREGGKNKTKEKEKKWSKILKTVPSNRRKIEKCNVQHRIYTAAWTASRVEDQS